MVSKVVLSTGLIGASSGEIRNIFLLENLKDLLLPQISFNSRDISTNGNWLPVLPYYTVPSGCDCMYIFIHEKGPSKKAFALTSSSPERLSSAAFSSASFSEISFWALLISVSALVCKSDKASWRQKWNANKNGCNQWEALLSEWKFHVSLNC